MNSTQQSKHNLLAKPSKRITAKALKVCALVLAIIGTTIPLQSLAAPTWSLPSTIESTPDHLTAIQAAQGGNGDAVALLWEKNYFNASIQRAGGTWTTPLKLVNYGNHRGVPDLTFSPNDSAVFIYGNKILTLPPNSSAWSKSAIKVGSQGWFKTPDNKLYLFRSAENSRIRFDQMGNGIATWMMDEWAYTIERHPRLKYYRTIIQAATYHPTVGWSTPVDLSGPVGFHDRPDLAVNDNGDAVVTWRTTSHECFYCSAQIEVTRKHGDNPWSAPVVISDNQVPSLKGKGGQNVALSNDGRVTVVWYFAFGDRIYNPQGNIYAAQASPLGVWSPVDIVATDTLSRLTTAADKFGNVTVAWRSGLRKSISNYILVSTKKVGSTAWTEPLTLSTPGTNASADPSIAASKDGSVVVVGWSEAFNPVVSTYSALSGWTHPEILSQTTRLSQMEVTAGDGGSARAIWDGFNNSSNLWETQAASLIP